MVKAKPTTTPGKLRHKKRRDKKTREEKTREEKSAVVNIKAECASVEAQPAFAQPSPAQFGRLISANAKKPIDSANHDAVGDCCALAWALVQASA